MPRDNASVKVLSDDRTAAGLREQRRLNRVQISREHILDVAERLFGDQGYQATSLEQVAAGSEFSVGAIYKFFTSKRELLAAIMARRSVEMRATVDEIRANSPSGQDELLTLVSYYLDYFRMYPSYGRLTLRIFPAGLESVPDFAEYAADLEEGNRIMTSVLERGQREGTVREADSTWLATLVTGMIMFDHSLRNEQSAHQASVEEFLEVIRSAVAPSPAAGKGLRANKPGAAANSR
jgi:AcrR family transcriptional regulator